MLSLILSALSATGLVRGDSWGGAFSLGPSTANIIKAVTTLTPGEAPLTQTGELFLWPGMSNGTGDLIQTTLEAWPDNSWCGAAAGQWCVDCSIFGSFGQINGPAAAMSGTDAVTITYTLQSDKNTWLQTAVINGTTVSTLSYAAGPYMKGYGTGTECDDGCVGTIQPQYYKNTQITFDAPDPDFGDTLVLSGGTEVTGFSSISGGLIWTAATIYIPPMQTTIGVPTTTTTKKTSTTTSKATSTSTVKSTSTAKTTSTNKASSTTTAPGGSTTGVPLYGQCGGIGYSGSTTCASGTCTYENDYYSQCL